ncbi:MAG TPA: recombinase family protein [Xylella sp.]
MSAQDGRVKRGLDRHPGGLPVTSPPNGFSNILHGNDSNRVRGFRQAAAQPLKGAADPENVNHRSDRVYAKADFQIILVYDVSRWGRFQDSDESAYYEYICRRAGIQVAYCAEQFENDGSPVSTIVKGVKRAMAGEYSRELSVKVFAGQCRLIEVGLPARRACGLRSAPRADRPVRFDERAAFARRAQEPANRPRDLAARPGR